MPSKKAKSRRDTKLAERRFEDADVFVDDYFEPRRENAGISSGRVESYSQICQGPATGLKDHGEALMFDARILDQVGSGWSAKMKLVRKSIPLVSFICSNEGFKGSNDEPLQTTTAPSPRTPYLPTPLPPHPTPGASPHGDVPRRRRLATRRSPGSGSALS
jgi:hypothetical protein